MEPVRIGVIGAGDISMVYLNAIARSTALDLRAIATREPQVIAEKAKRFNAQAVSVRDLLADEAIELVVNLAPGVGLVDLALAIRSGSRHRTGAEFIVHSVEVMEAIVKSAKTRSVVDLVSTCERPATIDPEADAALIALSASPFDLAENASAH